MPIRRMPAGMNPGPLPQPSGLGSGRPGSNAQTMPQPIPQGQPQAAALPSPTPPMAQGQMAPQDQLKKVQRAALPNQGLSEGAGTNSADMLDPSLLTSLGVRRAR